MSKDQKEKIVYQSLKPGMSEALARFIKSVYGDTYPIKGFYNPEFIENLLAQKILYSIVAIDEDGQIVGNISTQLEKEGDLTADTTAGMVATGFRGLGIIGQLGLRMAYVYEKLGLCGVQLYAITLHTITQKQISDGGGIVTGILPAHFQKGTVADGFSKARGRVGVVSYYFPLKNMPSRSVYIPQAYKNRIYNIYKRTKCDREFLSPRKDNLLTHSIHEISINDRTDVISLRLIRAGNDMGEVLDTLTDTAFENSYDVQYIDISLSDPGCGFAVDHAKRKDFLYGCLILEREGSDRLRLQKLNRSTFILEDLHLSSKEAKSFLNLILHEMY
jgi:hypothetical protein